MDKAYSRINWVNSPSTTTALGATNLNKMDVAINMIDNRVITLDTEKLAIATANTMISAFSMDLETGIITVTQLNGTVTTYDTKLEKLAVNFSYDAENQRLVITLDDGTVQYVDMSALITQYEFNDSDTIAFQTDANGEVSASIKNGSITDAMLESGYLAAVTAQTTEATAQAVEATEQALEATAQADRAQNYYDLITEIGSFVYPTLYIDTSTGHLMSVGGENISFSIDSNGHLISEVVTNG